MSTKIVAGESIEASELRDTRVVGYTEEGYFIGSFETGGLSDTQIKQYASFLIDA